MRVSLMLIAARSSRWRPSRVPLLPALSSKVGMLKVGMEADVIVLKARTINTHPMINAPGTVVTMMDTSNVDTVIIGGTDQEAGRQAGGRRRGEAADGY